MGICYRFRNPTLNFNSTPWLTIALPSTKKRSKNGSKKRLQDCWSKNGSFITNPYRGNTKIEQNDWQHDGKNGLEKKEWPYPLLPFSCVPPVISMQSTERPVHHDFYWMLPFSADLEHSQCVYTHNLPVNPSNFLNMRCVKPPAKIARSFLNVNKSPPLLPASVFFLPGRSWTSFSSLHYSFNVHQPIAYHW